MRFLRVILLHILLACSLLVTGQSDNLFGVTNGSTTGQPDGYGTIFKLNSTDGLPTALFTFSGTNGSVLNSGVTFCQDGFLYGTTRYGGANDKGTIFKIKTDGSGFQKLYDFDGISGEDPSGGLIEGTNGFLYGSTVGGGANALGVIFKIAKDGSGFKILINLDFTNSGYSPRSRPTLVSNSIYITNAQGGQYDKGTILRQDFNDNFVKLVDFDGSATGSYPNASLIQGTDGSLYGTASAGGLQDVGTVFKLQTDGSGFQKLFDFSNDNGASPLSSLVEGSSGALYGTTFGGGGAVVMGQGIFYYGTIYKINKDGSGFAKLYNFGAPNDGSFPDASLVESNGTMFGVTLNGGANQAGTIFRINQDGSNYQKVYDFDGAIGSSPRYGLTKLSPTGPASIQFASASASRAEGSGAYVVKLTLSSALSKEERVTIQMINESGVTYEFHHADFITTPIFQNNTITLTLPIGSVEASFSIVPKSDHKRESPENITFSISNVTEGLVIGSQGSFVFTILDIKCHPHFLVSPNPTFGLIRLTNSENEECDDDLSDSIHAKLFSPSGELLLTEEGTTEQLSAKLSEKLQGRNGLYLVRIECDEEEFVLRIIKN